MYLSRRETDDPADGNYAFHAAKHPRARDAAKAAYAAQRQGKYWPMEKIIFEHQESLSDQDLEEKFLELAAPVLGAARARDWLAAIWRLDQPGSRFPV